MNDYGTLLPAYRDNHGGIRKHSSVNKYAPVSRHDQKALAPEDV
jgi:hypothetical protein